MDLVISSATEADIPTIAEILTKATELKVKHGDMAWGTEPYTAEDIAPMTSSGTLYLALLGDEAVGTFVLQWEDSGMWGEQPPDAGYLHQLAIKDGFHGHDLGTQIIDWAAGEVAKHGRPYLRLDCPASNKGLCVYYESQGFSLVATKPNPLHEGQTTNFYERPVH